MPNLVKDNDGQMVLTPQSVKEIVGGDLYPNRTLCVSLSEKLKTHAYGDVPKKLIEERRPNESEAIKSYREKIYVPITKRTMSKVISSLEKIRRSQDWNIQYDAKAKQSKIADGETLQDYCEIKYPHFSSITNWAFSVLMRSYLLDANGIVAIVPEKMQVKPEEYVRPIALFFNSDQIVDYVEGEYAVLRSHDTSTYYTENGQKRNDNGAIYYVITPTQCCRYEQRSAAKDDVIENGIYQHNIGILPAFKCGGLYHSRVNNETIYESRISGMIPSLDEAAREYSDLQAEILQHIHSEKYMFANSTCPVCNGTGNESFKTGEKDEHGNDIYETKVCHHCHGRGSVTNVSPYGEYIINASKFGENAIPTPPIGYVNKSTDIAKFEDEHVRQHIYDALAAINMEFLAETPIAQSGTAKAYDKDELNNFVNAIAEDIVRILDNVYFFVNEYRYKIIVPNNDARKALLPKINVPTKYDILNTSTLMAELKAARDAQVNPMILRELEIDYAKKQFNTDPEVARMVEITFDLDPLFGMSDDAKMTMRQNDGITESDYIISCNIVAFVRRAMRDNDKFAEMDYGKQCAILKTYADEVKKANEPKESPMFKGMFSGSQSGSGSQSQSASESTANESSESGEE